ncbi:hypothetical protein [Aestuariispira insulae]|uniref:Uncharacterized protein n=1 Tax=Aestuariispira insulae TaxID=1461337 RepID=A0A3D9H443_9PROT|nr:hypothetical protein [Aestuariispira insulae]RED43696.1 hypothetical protein DFP90_1217 [Aestuariispira insulae]
MTANINNLTPSQQKAGSDAPLPNAGKSDFAKMLDEDKETDSAARLAEKNADKKRKKDTPKNQQIQAVFQKLSEVQKSLLESMDGSDTGLEALRGARRRKARSEEENDQEPLEDEHAVREAIQQLHDIAKNSGNAPDHRALIASLAEKELANTPEPEKTKRLAPFLSMLDGLDSNAAEKLYQDIKQGRFDLRHRLMNSLRVQADPKAAPRVTPLVAPPRQPDSFRDRIESLLRSGQARMETSLETGQTGYVISGSGRPMAALVKAGGSGESQRYFAARLPAHFDNTDLSRRPVSPTPWRGTLLDPVDQGYPELIQSRIDGRRRLIGQPHAGTGYFLLDQQNCGTVPRLEPVEKLALVDGCFYRQLDNGDQPFLLQNDQRKYPLLTVDDGSIDGAKAAIQPDSGRVFEVTPKSGHILWEIVTVPTHDGETHYRVPTVHRGQIPAEQTSALARLCRHLAGNPAPDQAQRQEPAQPRPASKMECRTLLEYLPASDQQQTRLSDDTARIQRRMATGSIDFLSHSETRPPQTEKDVSLLAEADAIMGRDLIAARVIQAEFNRRRGEKSYALSGHR